MAEKSAARKYEFIKRTCYSANIIYLFVRIFYLVLFIVTKSYVLIWMDAVSILFYILSFFIIKKQKYYLYALLCGNEFLILMTTATIMVGFRSGFVLNLIGLCVVSFFTTYFSKNRDNVKSIIWTVLSFALFITAYFVSRFVAPTYILPDWMEMLLFTIHSVSVFALVAVYLVIFLRYAVSLENRIINESRTDELTQINNRYGLFDYIDAIKDRSEYTLAMSDIDDFKVINDTHGHVFGDHVLETIANVYSNAIDDSFACRYGGEEFIIILKGNNKKEVFKKLEALRKQIENMEFEFEGVKIKLTVTIGAQIYDKPMSVEKWIELADKKLYEGKNTGKNKIVL